ncbi:MAG: transposase [Spirochaetales bacterium]|nr:transposase [Spirochaetales bacterium]
MDGKEKNKHQNKKTKSTQGRSTKTKSAVVGIVERNGEVKSFHVKNINSTIVKTILDEIIKEKNFATAMTAYIIKEENLHGVNVISKEHFINNEAVRKALISRGIYPNTGKR